YGIRVANFSLLAGTNSSFLYDPLDKAVEKLWLNGIVVVTAAGNYGQDGQPTTIAYAPANDPFAITVGAADLNVTLATGDDCAAAILAAHPGWTSDQVKGALMLTAQSYSNPSSYSLGVGEINAAAAAAVLNPPNPNATLDQYLTSDPNGGGQIFDTASWSSAARANASWNSASWSSASWNSASWNSASWNSASWNSASWSSASWNSGQTLDGSLPSAS